ncbi:MAG: hypothetical protein AB1393_03370 [Candidatus Edwardsbacteria bacterium]
MPTFFKSLKFKFALAISLLVVLILLVDAIITVITKSREMKEDITVNAQSYAEMSVKPICEGYQVYYTSGFYKFREIMLDFLRMNRNVKKIQILDVSGAVCFDSEELETGRYLLSPSERKISETGLLENIKKLVCTAGPYQLNKYEKGWEIVVPYIEEWGRHRFSVRYLVLYDISS